MDITLEGKKIHVDKEFVQTLCSALSELHSRMGARVGKGTVSEDTELAIQLVSVGRIYESLCEKSSESNPTD